MFRRRAVRTWRRGRDAPLHDTSCRWCLVLVPPFHAGDWRFPAIGIGPLSSAVNQNGDSGKGTRGQQQQRLLGLSSLMIVVLVDSNDVVRVKSAAF